jgi:cyclic pyranopterin phosphate synthase
LFVGLGARKIRLTGGEPLLRKGTADLVGQLVAITGVEDVALTTNGLLLRQHAQSLRDAGLNRVTVSLDSHDDATFGEMNGRGFGTARVLEGIEAAAEAGLTPIKINCVVERGVNEDSIVPLARMFRGSGHVVRFIEFMDVGTLNDWNLAKVVPAREIVERISEVFPLKSLEPNYHGEVAERWAYEDGAGEVGVIASVSQPFCGGCHRARLTIEGELVTCLFAAGGRDLRGPLRDGASDDALREIISRTWRHRTDRYSEERAEGTDASGHGPTRPKIEMYQIGG